MNLQGKFTFKNGRIYEGMFERDHIVEYPNFTMDGSTTPDITQLRTQTPVPGGKTINLDQSKNYLRYLFICFSIIFFLPCFCTKIY